MEIQYYVPRTNKKKRRRVRINVLIILGLLLIFSGIVIVGVYLNSKHNKIFNGSTFYYVCGFKSKSYKEIESRQEDVKKLGGAGKIYQKDKFYYMVLSVYIDKESASEVGEINKKIYPDAEILEIKAEKPSKQKQREIKNNEVFFKFYKLLRGNVVAVLNLSMKRLAGNVSENGFCSELLKQKFEFEEIVSEIDNLINEKNGNLITNVNLVILYYNSFFNSYFDSDKKSSVICDFALSLVQVYVEFVNNL